MVGLEVRKGNRSRCVYCGENIYPEEKRVVIHNGPRQYNFPRNAHTACFIQRNRLPIVELAYELHLIDRERFNFIMNAEAVCPSRT